MTRDLEQPQVVRLERNGAGAARTAPEPAHARLGALQVLYCRSGNLFVLLHMLPKRTGKLPEVDITVAEERWAYFKQRMDTERRRPPRAAGTDAP